MLCYIIRAEPIPNLRSQIQYNSYSKQRTDQFRMIFVYNLSIQNSQLNVLVSTSENVQVILVNL